MQFLDQAKTRCYIASYSITNPHIIEKLVQLHNRGVDVQVLTDKTQAAGRRNKLLLEFYMRMVFRFLLVDQ